MYCQKCGKELDDEAVVCTQCGCATKNQTSQSVKAMDTDVQVSIGIIILSIVFWVVGVGMGINYMQSNNKTRQHAGKVYLAAALTSLGNCFIAGFLFSSIFSM